MAEREQAIDTATGIGGIAGQPFQFQRQGVAFQLGAGGQVAGDQALAYGRQITVGNLGAYFQFGVSKQVDQRFAGTDPLAGGHAHLGNGAVEWGVHGGASQVDLRLLQLRLGAGQAGFHARQLVTEITDAELPLAE